MSVKNIDTADIKYTAVENKEGFYKLGDPKCTWCDTTKDLSRNETYGTYVCDNCRKIQ